MLCPLLDWGKYIESVCQANPADIAQDMFGSFPLGSERSKAGYREKSLIYLWISVLKTDTGRLGEKPKVNG